MSARLLLREHLRRLGLLKYVQRAKKSKDRRALQKNGWRALEAMFAATARAGAMSWVEFGTLLGIVRSGAFIPGDADLDVGMRERDFTDELQQSLFETGFEKQWEFEWSGRKREIRLLWQGVGIDVFLAEDVQAHQYLYFFAEVPDTASVFERDVYRHRLTPVDDVKWIRCAGYDIPVPSQPELALEERYGLKWRVPDPTWNTLRSPRLEKLAEPGFIRTR